MDPMLEISRWSDDDVRRFTPENAIVENNDDRLDLTQRMAQEILRLRALVPSSTEPLFNVVLSWYDCAKVDAVFRLQYIVPSYRLAHLVEICEKGQAGDKPVVMKGVCKYTAMRWKKDFEKLNIHLELVPHKS